MDRLDTLTDAWARQQARRKHGWSIPWEERPEAIRAEARRAVRDLLDVLGLLGEDVPAPRSVGAAIIVLQDVRDGDTDPEELPGRAEGAILGLTREGGADERVSTMRVLP